MGHAYSSCLVHYVFSTKNRKRVLTRDLRDRLIPYLAGVARSHDMKALGVGVTDDHVHLLISLPSRVSMAKGMQLIKGVSSKWIHETFPTHATFAWQEGYGAFTVGVSGVEGTLAYINTQEEHHRSLSFEEEFIGFLRKHGIEYDERYVFG